MSMFRSKTKLEILPLQLVFNQGGLGDFICRIPPVIKMLTHYPQVSLILWVPDFFDELANYWLVDFVKEKRVRIVSGKEELAKFDTSQPLIEFKTMAPRSFALHLMQQAHITLFAEVMPESEVRYPVYSKGTVDISKFKLPEKYLVLTTEATSKTRKLTATTLNGITEYFKDKMQVVYLGKRDLTIIYKAEGVDNFDYSSGLDLRDQTSLMECAEILANAQGVLGIDNGLLHLASCSDVPVVFAFSTVKPEHRLCGRNGKTEIVEPSGDCTYCQAKIRYVKDHTFTTCFYGDYKCLDTLTAEKFIKAWEAI